MSKKYDPQQEAINQQEWSNPDNWSGPRYPGIYFSKKDPRIWVPKKNVRHGWTLNLAHDKGVWWLLALLLLTPTLIALFGLLVISSL